MRASASRMRVLLALLAVASVLAPWGCGDESGRSGAASVTTAVLSSATEPAGDPSVSDAQPAEVAVAEATAGEQGGAQNAAPDSPGVVVPGSIAGLALSGWVQGEAARAQVEQLHGKTLGAGVDEAWVAQYGDGEAVLWVTRALRHEDARDLYVRMVDRIAEGNSPFGNAQPIGVPGVEGYSLDGLGQKHYYFLIGGDLYWLAVDPERADEGLDELAAQAAAVAGVE